MTRDLTTLSNTLVSLKDKELNKKLAACYEEIGGALKAEQASVAKK